MVADGVKWPYLRHMQIPIRFVCCLNWAQRNFVARSTEDREYLFCYLHRINRTRNG